MIYLDNAATTQCLPEVVEKMKPYMYELYGNPLGVYSFARESKAAVENARKEIANVISCDASEIYFTSGGTEADNWALIATAEAYEKKGKHIITSPIEHHAVLHTMEYLKSRGFEISYVHVNDKGMVDVEHLKTLLREDTILISIMMANNEIGTIEPIETIGQIAREHEILFHCDAVQAFGHIPIDVMQMHIDLLSVSAHKLHGPKGVGMLYIRKGLLLKSYQHGGDQEKKRRAGTHNVAGIVGFGEAARISKLHMMEHRKQQCALRDYLIHRVLEEIPDSQLNGDDDQRLPNNANFCFRYIDGESLLSLLDQQQICASSGSACTSGSLKPSHVLLAIGVPYELASSSLRITLSHMTTKKDIDITIDALKKSIEKLRKDSYLWVNDHSASV